MDRIVIEDVRPRTPNGYPAKGIVERPLPVSALVFRDGHDVLAARARWRPRGDRKWTSAPLTHVANDRWEGEIEPTSLGAHELVIEAWTDQFATWRRDIELKHDAGQDVDVELEEGARMLEGFVTRVNGDDRKLVQATIGRLRDSSTRVESRVAAGLDPGVASAVADLPGNADLSKSTAFPVWVDRERAAVGAWYELFPRSYGGLRGAAERLTAVADKKCIDVDEKICPRAPGARVGRVLPS